MNIKKIIAREGLILLGIIIISVFLGHHAYSKFWADTAPKLNLLFYLYYSYPTLWGAILNSFIALYLIYFSFWIIRFINSFIIWAIDTLKEKK